MASKIFKTVFFSFLLLFFVFFVIVFSVLYNGYSDGVEEQLKSDGEYLAAAYEASGTEFLEELKDGSYLISIIASDGKTVFDSLNSEDDLSLLEEVKGAFGGGSAFCSRYSAKPTGEVVYFSYYAIRLSDGGVLRVAAERESAVSMLSGVLPAAAIAFVIWAIILFIIAKRLSAEIVRPISEIDFKNPERNKVYDELKPIVDKISAQNHELFRQTNELRIKQNEFSSITTNMSEGLIIINLRGEVLSCNKSAKDIFGIKKEVPTSVLSIDNSASFRELVLSALSGSSGFDTVRKNGRFYSMTASPVMHGGNVDGAVIIIIDETEKEEREALRREFTSNISHELKTPLTSISGFAELISSGLAEGEDAKKFAGKITLESQRLITLVGDIIRLTQLDGGEIPYDECEVNLYSVAEDVVSHLANVAEKENVTLSLSGEKISVRGNSTILFELIYNLVDNGIKYNKKDGTVDVKVGFVSGLPTVSVRDSGIGIPEDKRQRVFERFFRVDKSHSKEIGGTGLGLSIVKHAASYHGAKIELKSALGKGTEIKVLFPKNNEADASAETEK